MYQCDFTTKDDRVLLVKKVIANTWRKNDIHYAMDQTQVKFHRTAERFINKIASFLPFYKSIYK